MLSRLFGRKEQPEGNAKWGLVLSGGGTKGAYEVGAWKAIQELGIPVKCVTGTSIGALNSALILQNDYQALYDLWNTIQITDVLPVGNGVDPNRDVFDPQNILALAREFVKQGGLDNSPLRRSLENHLDLDKVYNSPMDIGIVTYNIGQMTPTHLFREDIPREKMIDYLIASANFPIYKAQSVDGKRFIDGGVYDNMPINPLVERGYTHIITIDINGIGLTRRVEKPDDVFVKTIRCSEDLGGTFDFNRDRIRKNITLGYLDTMKGFRKLYGNHFFFTRKAFNDLMLSFDLETIRGLEIAAREYGMDRYRVYHASDFIKELCGLHAAREDLNRTVNPKEANPLTDAVTVTRGIENGTAIPFLEHMIMKQPNFRSINPLAKLFPDQTEAAAAMIELKNAM